MILERFVNGRARSNAYVFAPDPDRAVLIDPGVGAAPRVARFVHDGGLRPVGILLTHGHPDHTWTSRELSERYGVPVFLHRADWRWLDDPATGGHVPLVRLAGLAVGRLRRVRPARLQEADGSVEVAGVAFRVLHTPGHTAGSSCFIAGDICFVGDTAFAGGVGHTVYPGGRGEALRRSIGDGLLGLSDEVRLLPGHGPETTMARERAGYERFARGRGD